MDDSLKLLLLLIIAVREGQMFLTLVKMNENKIQSSKVTSGHLSQ